MSSITNESFRLRIINALIPQTSFFSGANTPLLITGVDEDGNTGEYVVKFKGAKRMSPEASMRELLATLIAIQMGIHVATPVIVNVTANFIDLVKDKEGWACAQSSLGLNFGTEYIKNFTNLIPTREFSLEQLSYAQLIFPFDVTIHNPDRTNENPNMLTDGSKIVIYDHELAFSFILNIFPDPDSWKIKETDMWWVSRHVLLPKISGKVFDFAEFSTRFDNLDEDFWNTAKDLIPQEWLTDQFDKIKRHFVEINNNKEAFINELKKLMS